MKNIKFRAFIKHIGWVVPVEQINFDVETIEADLSSGQGDTSEYGFDEVELMQGVDFEDDEIYEGDIFHLGDENIRYVVVWEDTSLMGKQVGSSIYVGLKHWANRIKVLGNIHINPELLKGELK